MSRMYERLMRLSVPEDFSEDSVTVIANTLFIHFANDLSGFISTFMEMKYGVAWLQDLRVMDTYYRNFNPKDPAALLKDLARNGSSKLRIALHSKVERGFLKDYYQDLDDLLGERNAWLHRQVQETESELLDLIISLLRVSAPLNLRIVEDCHALQQAILEPAQSVQIVQNQVPAAILETADSIEFLVSTPENLIKESEPAPNVHPQAEETTTSTAISMMLDGEMFQIGELVSDSLLSHSYVLHLNGDIRDRASDQLLANVNSTAATTLGALLIARKPNGGRIRITAEGVLCAFFGDKWGYLAQVKPQDWFPGHLADEIQQTEET